jgi:DNA (cytosine-5)-methyltransferase 1
MLRAIQEIKPKFVIAENVFGITNIDGGMVFEQVCLDLEAEGYEVQPFIIPAAAKNAPHRRDRVWFIAKNTNCIGLDNGKIDTRRGGNRKLEPTSNKWQVNKTHWDATDTINNGFIWSIDGKCKNKLYEQSEEKRFKCNSISFKSIATTGIRRAITDTNLSRFKEKGEQSKSTTQNKRIEYSSCGWEQFPTQPPICSGDDGLPTELDGITFSKWRAESIKGYGNAIVPQVAYELFKQIAKL